MTRKITRKQWDAFTPAQQTMWIMQGMVEPPEPPAEPTNKRVGRIQDAIEDLQKTMARVRGDDE